MRVTEDNSAASVMITPNTVHASARSPDRFQVMVLPLYSIMGFVRSRAAIAGILNAMVPEKRNFSGRKNRLLLSTVGIVNAILPEGSVSQARAQAPSMIRPRRTMRMNDRNADGAVKIYLVSCPSFTSLFCVIR